jgi:hypothetical protein
VRPPERSPSLRGVVALASRLGVIQIDSVNVLARAHYLPVFSRLGAYPREWLDVASSVPPRRLFEYWGHEASLLPVEAYPLFRWRMARAHLDAWGGMRRIMTDRPDLPDALLAAVAAEGPVTAAELEQHHGRTGAGGDAWGWRWSEVKRTLEYLFWAGELCSAGRGPGFERRYDLPERVLPARVLAMPVPDAPDAIRRLVDLAARAHGVATAACLRDYFRLPVAECRTALAELVDAGQLRPVTVDGWTDQAFLHPDTVVPRRACGRALLAPFDPLVWSRRRVQRLFGFAYRLEIYVPAAQRVHGYYVLPFLLGDRLVGRVDLKADRATGRLLAASSWVEPDAPPDTAPELARALREMADWLELDAVVVHPRGDLAADLTQSVAQLAG